MWLYQDLQTSQLVEEGKASQHWDTITPCGVQSEWAGLCSESGGWGHSNSINIFLGRNVVIWKIHWLELFLGDLLSWWRTAFPFLLEALQVLNPDHTNIIKFFEWFEHMGHICISFEMLDWSLYDLFQEQDWKPLSLNEIQPRAKQVCIIVIWNQLSIVLRINYSSMSKTLNPRVSPYGSVLTVRR